MVWSKILELGTVALIPISPIEFDRSESEPTLYTNINEQGNMLIFFVYVYGLIFTGEFGKKDFRTIMEIKFEMTNLGLMNFFWELKPNNMKVVYLYHSPSMQV